MDDGVLTIKQPQWHDTSNSSWHYFGSTYSGQYADDMTNGAETATVPNANQYAYHTYHG